MVCADSPTRWLFRALRLAGRSICRMPACHARYDVLFNDGTGISVGHGARNRALVDMQEEREPDEWGDPGRLVSAQLHRWWSPFVRSIDYAPVGRRDRMRLWVDGVPRITRAHRRHLRWWVPEEDPPPDWDPDWITPP